MEDEKVCSCSPKTTSILSCLLLVFICDLGFALVIPSLWPYVESLGGSQTVFGVIIASFSVGRLTGAPLLGWLVTKQPYKRIFVLALFIDICGNILYALTGNLYAMVVGRYLCGFASGVKACVQSYFSKISTKEERTAIFSKIGAATTLAYALGPALGAVFSFIPNFYIKTFYFGALNLPSVMHVCLLIGTILFKIFLFYEESSVPDTMSTPINETPEPQSPPLGLLVLMIFIQFLQCITFVVYEAVATPLTESLYAWGITQNGILWVAISIVSAVSYFCVGLVSRQLQVPDTTIYSISSTVLIIAMGIMVDIDLPLWKWLLGTCLVSLSFPGGDATLVSTFTKILGPIPQGFYLGCYSASASLARISGPIWAATLHDLIGSWAVFWITGLCQTLALILILLNTAWIHQTIALH